jgi:hypothetical protein
VSGYIAGAAIALTFACRGTQQRDGIDPRIQRSAIEYVFAKDDELGSTRNEAASTAGVARAAHEYAIALRRIDYRNTPADFKAAYLKHADAWMAIAEEVSNNAGFAAIRAEMHEAFDTMLSAPSPAAASLKQRLDYMWETWREVEAAAEEHGVRPSGN